MSNILMNKTKKELVDIILRKDDIHKKLKEDNDDLYSKIALINNTNKDLNNKIKGLQKLISDKDVALIHKNNDISKLITQVNDFTDTCDEYASRCQEIVDKCNKFKNLAILSTCITIVVLISMFILL